MQQSKYWGCDYYGARERRENEEGYVSPGPAVHIVWIVKSNDKVNLYWKKCFLM